jgi:uncharacterized LabA/DUF88 family protein
MASSPDNISMAVFCDFENVALGVRDANYEKFDIKPILERLLLKGSIVVKKAYCDWDRYKAFKATMHEANFELIEIPHVRQSGKNSADIRLVVDALDLCYTKSHVNTFVIISGDSDFSPLVSKLRENNKQVIGVGVKQSTSDLLVANCDEFIFYDDLVREVRRAAAKRDERKSQPSSQPKRAPDENNKRKEELESRKAQAIEMVVEMFDALVSERGDSGKIWASLLKDTLKRRRPDFNETYFGFRTFGNLLEEAQTRGMLEFGRDEKSGAYVFRSERAIPMTAPVSAPAEQAASTAPTAQEQAREQEPEAITEPAAEEVAARPEPRRRGRGGRTDFRAPVIEAPAAPVEAPAEPAVEAQPSEASAAETPVWTEESPFPPPQAEEKQRRSPRGGRKGAAKKSATPAEAPPVAVEPVVVAVEPAPAPAEAVEQSAAPARKAARKPAARSRRPAKPKASPENA